MKKKVLVITLIIAVLLFGAVLGIYLSKPSDNAKKDAVSPEPVTSMIPEDGTSDINAQDNINDDIVDNEEQISSNDEIEESEAQDSDSLTVIGEGFVIELDDNQSTGGF